MHHYPIDLNIKLLDLNRAPLTGPIGDVQSQAFSTSIAVNPLVAAAMPLLSRIANIEHISSSIEPIQLSQNLQHEIKAFENAAHKNGYQSQLILAARYVLCTVLDELIEGAHPKLNWHTQALLHYFQSETYGGERFFIILERSFEDPALYIDLLELGYICLSLGFKGKYKDPIQQQALGIFTDQLYQFIETQRGEHAPTLTQVAHTTVKHAWRLPPWWVMLVSCGMILSAIFIPYTLKLNKVMTPLIYNINHYD